MLYELPMPFWWEGILSKESRRMLQLLLWLMSFLDRELKWRSTAAPRSTIKGEPTCCIAKPKCEATSINSWSTLKLKRKAIHCIWYIVYTTTLNGVYSGENPGHPALQTNKKHLIPFPLFWLCFVTDNYVKRSEGMHKKAKTSKPCGFSGWQMELVYVAMRYTGRRCHPDLQPQHPWSGIHG